MSRPPGRSAGCAGRSLVINVAMLLSTPVEGTHYLADMIAGALVAIAALGIVAEVRFRLAACEPAA